jgi:hypothetical protein
MNHADCPMDGYSRTSPRDLVARSNSGAWQIVECYRFSLEAKAGRECNART